MRSSENEPFEVLRDVDAVMVPSGHPITLKAGITGYITQALGGSFTLYIEGNLYRIPGEAAEAIGKEIEQAPELPADATAGDIREIAWARLRTCYDPEIPINIVDLGLVYLLDVTENPDGTRDIEAHITVTAPGCGMGDILVDDAKSKLATIPTVREIDVSLVFDPPWDRSMMSEAARLQTGMMW
jgi:probable FeS assembly SUF system protein SufT